LVTSYLRVTFILGPTLTKKPDIREKMENNKSRSSESEKVSKSMSTRKMPNKTKDEPVKFTLGFTVIISTVTK
jgi:hypothetical protein